MGAGVIGCVAATMMSGAYAQEANTGQFNARPANSRPFNRMHRCARAKTPMNGHVNGRPAQRRLRRSLLRLRARHHGIGIGPLGIGVGPAWG